jgi:hypothetical protein
LLAAALAPLDPDLAPLDADLAPRDADLAPLDAALAPLDADRALLDFALLALAFALRPVDFAARPADCPDVPDAVRDRLELLLAAAARPVRWFPPDDRLELLFALPDGSLPLLPDEPPLDDLRLDELAVLPRVAERAFDAPEAPFEDDLFRDVAGSEDPRSVVAAISLSPPCRKRACCSVTAV